MTKPRPRNGEVVIKVINAGICRTDRKCYHRGQRDLSLPRILGHEIVGIIDGIGNQINDYEIGQRVQIHPGIGCGKCQHCLSGNDHLCAEMKILGFHLDGGFSEYCLIPKEGVKNGIIQPVPDNLPLDTAVLCEPLACAVNMASKTKFKNKNILIIGGGVLGLLMAKLAQYYGCGDVIILEKYPAKIKIALSMGIKCLPENTTEIEFKKFWQRGADIAIPCCPQNDAFSKSIKLLNPGGELGFFSGLTADEPIPREIFNLIHYKELSVYGSYGCSLKNAKTALKLLAEKPDFFQLPTKEININNLKQVLQNEEITQDIYTQIKFK